MMPYRRLDADSSRIALATQRTYSTETFQAARHERHTDMNAVWVESGRCEILHEQLVLLAAGCGPRHGGGNGIAKRITRAVHVIQRLGLVIPKTEGIVPNRPPARRVDMIARGFEVASLKALHRRPEKQCRTADATPRRQEWFAASVADLADRSIGPMTLRKAADGILWRLTVSSCEVVVPPLQHQYAEALARQAQRGSGTANARANHDSIPEPVGRCGGVGQRVYHPTASPLSSSID